MHKCNLPPNLAHSLDTESNKRHRINAMNKPLLSICIPTYNHAHALHKILENIVSLPVFLESEEIEIVISDNASSDGTQSVAMSFAAEWPNRVRYFRNDTNVLDKNFEMALSRGCGSFRKLANDTLLIKEPGLRKMLLAIKENIKEKPLMFFTNGNGFSGSAKRECHSFEEAIAEISFFVTWIGGFGLWEEQFAKVHDFSQRSDSRLVQTDVFFRMLDYENSAVVYNFRFEDTLPRPRKGRGYYSLAEVFGKNYFSILQPYVTSGKLSKRAYTNEKKRVLRELLLPYMLNGNTGFSSEGYVSKLLPLYGLTPHYLLFLPIVLAVRVIRCLSFTKVVVDKFSFAIRRILAPHLRHRMLWRFSNRHNRTYAVNEFDRARVSVGHDSYGGLEIYSGNDIGTLFIGNFVSIGPGVRFIPGGGHPLSFASTFPFGAFEIPAENEDLSKGPIVVNDDVWIGAGATILSNVTIGQGAVVAAGAVVTKSTPPYAIVGGDPAKVIRYRFPEAICRRLLELDWSAFPQGKVKKMRDALKTPVTDESVDIICRTLAKLNEE